MLMPVFTFIFGNVQPECFREPAKSSHSPLSRGGFESARYGVHVSSSVTYIILGQGKGRILDILITTSHSVHSLVISGQNRLALMSIRLLVRLPLTGHLSQNDAKIGVLNCSL